MISEGGVGAETLGPSFAAILDILVENWMRRESAGSQTAAHIECWHCPLHCSTAPGGFVFEAVLES